MQSGENNQSQNLARTVASPLERPIANNIQKSLVDGTSITDFVAKNSPGYKPPPVNSSDSAVQQEVNRMVESKQEVVVTPPPTADVVPDVTLEDTPEEVVEEHKDEDSQDADTQDPDLEEEGTSLKGSSAENFKRLRTKVKELKDESTKKDKLLTELTTELKKYSSGEKLPEELVKREERIAELEHYEKLLNLKKSRYYQDNFVKPLGDIQSRLSSMAKAYGIDPKRVLQAANYQNEADLNKFLSTNFDVVGAGEIKAIVKEYRSLQTRAVEAEKEPAEALNKMIQSAEAVRRQQQVERLEVMQDISRDAWRESLDYIKEEGKVRELIYKEGDLDHNSKVFTPIVQAAATEYGKLVNQLAKNGLESLPKPLAYALSRLCQLAHASAVSIQSRERAVAMAEQLENNTQRTQRYIRPSVSGGVSTGKGSSNGAGAGGGPSSTMEAAESLLKQVRGR